MSGDISKMMRGFVDWMAWTTENQPSQWGGYLIWAQRQDGSKFISFNLMFIGE